MMAILCQHKSPRIKKWRRKMPAAGDERLRRRRRHAGLGFERRNRMPLSYEAIQMYTPDRFWTSHLLADYGPNLVASELLMRAMDGAQKVQRVVNFCVWTCLQLILPCLSSSLLFASAGSFIGPGGGGAFFEPT